MDENNRPERMEEVGESSSSGVPPQGVSGSIPLSIGNRFNSETLQFRVRGSTITAGSPPKFISFAEIMSAAHGIQNMTLAHEIAIDDDFRLEPFEPPDNSYHKIVKDTMHRAFFDVLRLELNSDPPIFKQAFVLLDDVKQGLFSILLPRHTKIREMVEEVLDQSFIKQQAENGAIEFKKYSDFVLDLMAKLAAPVRDEMIQNISKLEDTVDIFQSILETLEVMKLDLANTLITMIRPFIQAQTVQYEQEKFKKFLEIQEDGLDSTRLWIVPHIDRTVPKPEQSDPIYLRNVTSRTMANAYLELLEWDPKKEYPETVRMDSTRYSDLAKSLYRLVMSACILLVGPSHGSPDQPAAQEFKAGLKNKITIIMENISDDDELKSVLPNIAEQVIADANTLLVSVGQTGLDDSIKQTIFGQISALIEPEHKVRELVRRRVLEFLKEILICGGGSRRVPVGLSVFCDELTSISGLLLRLVMHNKAVYGSYYNEIVARQLDIE